MEPVEWIEINDLELETWIGVPEREREIAQRLLVRIRFQIDRSFASLGDRIADTTDYSAVAAETGLVARNNRAQLLETLAGEIADHLMRRFSIRCLEVELKKFVLPQTRYVSARTTRGQWALP